MTTRGVQLRTRKQAFTMVEAMVAVAIGALVFGAAMILYNQGNKMFYKTTEHAAFREESMLCLETIARDLEQLIVSDGTKPNGTYYMVQPYELVGTGYDLQQLDPTTGKLTNSGQMAYEGVRFMRYHNTQTNAQGQPVIVGQLVSYTTKPVSSNPADGKNLYRDGDTRPINKMPLQEIAFVQENMQVTADEIGASPHAVLTVMIVPQGNNYSKGMHMTQDTVNHLRADKALVSRTFHLSGYETYYTLMLNEAFRQQVNANQNPGSGTGLTGVYQAVYQDAKSTLSQAQFAAVLARFQAGSAASVPSFNYLFEMDYNTTFQDATAGQDTYFQNMDKNFTMGPVPSGPLGGGGATGGGGEGGEGGEGG